MRSNTLPECRPLRQRPPRRLVAEAGAVVHRGLAELKPRRLSYPKLAATAVRQMACKSPKPMAGALVHMPLAAADAELTLRLLADLPELMLQPALFPALLDQLQVAPDSAAGGRRIVVVLGDGEPLRGDAHTALARSLTAFNPQIEPRFVKELRGRYRDGAPGSPGEQSSGLGREPFVVEERPGKALALALEEPTLKLSRKRWQSLAARAAGDASRLPLATSDGWGIGACVLGTPAAGVGRELTLASFDGQFPGDALNLDSGRQIHAAAARWLAGTAGFDLGAIRRIVLCVPWLAVAATIGAAFARPGAPGPRLIYPDLTFGWQPLLSLIEFLYGDELPALFVHTGRFPELHLVAVW